MVFGISKRFLRLIFNPYLLYKEIKKKKTLKKYSDVFLALGENVSVRCSKIGNYVYLGNDVSLSNSEIGNHSYVNSKTSINFTKIGKFCSIGPNVKFGMGLHPINLISTHPSFYSNDKKFKTFANKNHFVEYKETILGNDVWIGSDVMVMGGVNIADGAVVAAGAIVTKDIEPYEVVGGIPAKHIKYRINKDLINKVRKIEWWNKDERWFEENYNLFLNQEIFLKYFKLK